MSTFEGILLFFIFLMMFEVEDIIHAYRERTRAILRIAGIYTESNASKILSWIKRNIK